MFSPDYYYRSVQDIDLGALKERGVTTLLVDLDNTLLPRNSEGVTDDARAWVASVLTCGMQLCIVSNNWHARVEAIAAQMGVPIVARAVKPLPKAFRTALVTMDARREETAVVGDQMFTDVLGGNLLGLATVLVVPLSASDLPHTRLLRLIERVLLANRRPLP